MNTNNIENEIFGIVAIWKAKAKDCIDNDEVPPTFVEVAMEEFNRVGKTKIEFENGGCFEFPASKGNDVLKSVERDFPVWGRAAYGASPWSGSGGDRGQFFHILRKARDIEDWKREILNQPVPWGVEDEGLQVELSKESREVLEKYRNRLGERGIFVEIPDFPENPVIVWKSDMEIKPVPHLSEAKCHSVTMPSFPEIDSVRVWRRSIEIDVPSDFMERRSLVKAQRDAWKNRKLGL